MLVNLLKQSGQISDSHALGVQMKGLSRRSSLNALLLAACAPLYALAQGHSGKPISIVVPYPAGGPADVTARQMEAVMRRSLGQAMIVENISGASGAIGIDKVLAGPKDGSMLLFGTPSDIILAPIALAAVKHKPDQLRMVGMATRTPLLLVSGMQVPPQKLIEIINARKSENAKPLSYGSMGTGSMPHFAGEDLAARTKLKVTHIPYKGIAPLVQDLIGGQVELGFLPVAGNTLDLVMQGKLRAYGVSSDARLLKLPDVPTIAEATGIGEFNFEIWGGLFVSKSVPLETAKRLNMAANEALADADYRRQIEAAGAGLGNKMSLQEAENFFVAQIARYGKLAAAIKLEPQ